VMLDALACRFHISNIIAPKRNALFDRRFFIIIFYYSANFSIRFSGAYKKNLPRPRIDAFPFILIDCREDVGGCKDIF
jgi:hypothetical protein